MKRYQNTEIQRLNRKPNLEPHSLLTLLIQPGPLSKQDPLDPRKLYPRNRWHLFHLDDHFAPRVDPLGTAAFDPSMAGGEKKKPDMRNDFAPAIEF